MAFRERRMKTGMSVKEVADRLGISRQAVNDYEIGKSEPRIGFLKDMAALYGCTIEELIGPEEGKGETNERI